MNNNDNLPPTDQVQNENNPPTVQESLENICLDSDIKTEMTKPKVIINPIFKAKPDVRYLDGISEDKSAENSTGSRILLGNSFDGSLTNENLSNVTTEKNNLFNGDNRVNNANHLSLAKNVLSQSATKLQQSVISFPKSLFVDNKRPPNNVVQGTKRQRKASDGHVQATNSMRKYLAKLTQELCSFKPTIMYTIFNKVDNVVSKTTKYIS